MNKIWNVWVSGCPKIIKSIPFLVFHLIHFKIFFATKNKPVVTGYFI